MRTLEPHGALGQGVRFVLVGAANTIVTGGIFYALSLVMSTALAYTLAFALGILASVAFTPRLVFMVRTTNARRALYASWYVSVYVVGLGLIEALEHRLALERPIVVVVTVGTTAVLTFGAARRLFRPAAPAESPG
jgi:putative flippase GtrA